MVAFIEGPLVHQRVNRGDYIRLNGFPFFVEGVSDYAIVSSPSLGNFKVRISGGIAYWLC